MTKARLAAIGQVAGGIARELRNPLGPACNAADALQGKVGSGPRQEFLHGSYTPAELLQQIRELLDQPKATTSRP